MTEARGESGPAEPAAITGRARLVRRLGWTLTALVVGAGLLMSVAGLPEGGLALSFSVVYLISVACAVIALAMAAVRSAGYERDFWTRLGLAMVLLAASESSWVLYTAFARPVGPAFPVVDNLFDLAALAVLMSLLFTLTEVGDGSTVTRLRYFFDIVSAGVIGAVPLFVLVTGPVFTALGAPLPAAASAALYPLFGLIVVVWAISQLFGVAPSRWTGWEVPAISGAITLSIGFMWWPLWYLSANIWRDGSVARLSDLLAVAGALLIGMAAVYRLTETGSEWRLQPMPPVETPWPRVVRSIPMVVALVSLAVFAALLVTTPAGSVRQWVLLGSSALLTTLVVLRAGIATIRARRMETRAGVDPLTGLNNHRYFHERLTLRLKTAGDRPLSIALVDIDDFGQIDRVSGLEAGDRLLQRVAKVVVHSLQGDDEACRFGADEFGLILADTDSVGAVAMAEHVLAGIRRIEDPSGSTLRASAGVASSPEHFTEREALVEAVDQALALAKFAGKDRAVVWSSDQDRVPDREHLAQRAREQAYVATVRATAAAVDSRIPERTGHSQHVGTVSLRLARRLGMDEEVARKVETAGQLHDVGKVGVPDAALMQAPDDLTPELRRRLEEHPLLGATIVASTGLTEIAPWIAAHHERWDGRGYPEGRAGEEIPLAARIITVADGYDAYLGAQEPDSVKVSRTLVAEHMRAGMNTAWDPLVVLHLLSLLADEEVASL
jgi:diguanylate cyclase (GGDEF)-like protein